MGKIDKSLKKFSEKEKSQIKNILHKLKSRSFRNLDIKKLKGREDIFRARKGSLRVIYRIKKEKIFILTIERRREDTYKF